MTSVVSAVRAVPKISVVMPLCNNAEHFSDAVESVLSQSFADFECIVIDDASRDSSPALLRSYAGKDERIRPIFLKKNRGLMRVSQIGLEHARAPIVARMDSDDLSLPGRLQTQYAYLQKYEEVGLLTCGFLRFTEKVKGRKRIVNSGGSLMSEHQERLRYQTGRPTVRCIPSVMFCKKTALEAGGYRDFFVKGAEDRDFVLRMHERTKVASIADKFYAYRINPKSRFRKDTSGLMAGRLMATYCALLRRCGKKDPLAAAQPISRLPRILGLQPSIRLEDLQQDPRWTAELLFRWLEEKPFDDGTCALLCLGLVGHRFRGRGGARRAFACLLRAIKLDGTLTARLAVRAGIESLLYLSVLHRDFWRQPSLENK